MSLEWRVVSRMPDEEPIATDPMTEGLARAVYDRAKDKYEMLWAELQRRPRAGMLWEVIDWFGVRLVEIC